jgi:hypothetical protein
MEKVWLVYRMVPVGHHMRIGKTEAVFRTEAKAKKYCKKVEKEWDSKFGIQYQEWFFDDADN